MDEIRSRKMIRRLALLAVINSVAIGAAASEPTDVNHGRPPAEHLGVPSAQPEVTLRSLLASAVQAEGSLPQAPADDDVAGLQIDVPRTDAIEQSSDDLRAFLTQGWEPNGRYSVTIKPRAAEKHAESKAVPETRAKATVLRPKRQPLSVAERPAEDQTLKPLDLNLKSTSLADLLRKVPDSGPEATKPSLPDKPVLAARPTEAADALQPKLADEGVEEPMQQLDDDAKSTSLADLLKQVPVLKTEAATPSLEANSVANSGKNQSSVTEQPKLVEQSLESPVIRKRQTELLHDTVIKDGFGFLAIDEIELPVVDEPVQQPPLQNLEKPSIAMMHATRLQEVAQGLLRDAFHSMRRGANYTAKKKASAALRSVIAMHDAADGGNRHSREFEVALDAIRESQDFGAGIKVVDHKQLERLVAVHKTGVLKDQPLTDVSPLAAMSAYLEFARNKLIAASGQQQEAGYALQLLGQLEKQINGSFDAHAAAVALTYQRAAVEVDPANAIALYELGKTYSVQGLPEQARISLTRSIELSPSRGAYEELMETARKLGDIDTVKRCKVALADASLPSSYPVFELAPEVFAATYRPQLAQTHRSQSQQATANLPATERAATKKSQPKHSSQLSTSPHIKPDAPSSQVTTKNRLRSWFSSNR